MLGIELVKTVYEATRLWPKQETYGLAAQVQRAAVSVPANIAEGVGRHSHAGTARLVQVALGSSTSSTRCLRLRLNWGTPYRPTVTPAWQSLSARPRPSSTTRGEPLGTNDTNNGQRATSNERHLDAHHRAWALPDDRVRVRAQASEKTSRRSAADHQQVRLPLGGQTADHLRRIAAFHDRFRLGVHVL